MFPFTSLKALGFHLGAINLRRREYQGFWQFWFRSSGLARAAVGVLRAAGFKAHFFTQAGLPIVQVCVPCTVGFAQ